MNDVRSGFPWIVGLYLNHLVYLSGSLVAGCHWSSAAWKAVARHTCAQPVKVVFVYSVHGPPFQDRYTLIRTKNCTELFHLLFKVKRSLGRYPAVAPQLGAQVRIG